MQQYQRKRVCSQVGMKGEASVQHYNAPAGQPESLGIDDSKIQTKFECQVGKSTVHIRNEKLQQFLATGFQSTDCILLRQTAAEKHDSTCPADPVPGNWSFPTPKQFMANQRRD